MNELCLILAMIILLLLFALAGILNYLLAEFTNQSFHSYFIHSPLFYLFLNYQNYQSTFLIAFLLIQTRFSSSLLINLFLVASNQSLVLFLSYVLYYSYSFYRCSVYNYRIESSPLLPSFKYWVITALVLL